jgi:hypothetical protein
MPNRLAYSRQLWWICSSALQFLAVDRPYARMFTLLTNPIKVVLSLVLLYISKSSAL